MNRQWNDRQPIYRQLRDLVVAMVLDGVLKEGDPLVSVRHVAADYRVNPLTVLKAYQELVDEQLVEAKRGRGMFIRPARAVCCWRWSGRGFLPSNGPGSTRLSSASGSRWKRC